MNDQSKTIGPYGRVEIEGADDIFLPDDAIQRVGYALCTFATTPLIEHVNITGLFTSTGVKVWPPS